MKIDEREAQRGFLVLRKAIGVEILPGEAKDGGPPLVYFRLRHTKLPRGGIMFAMPAAFAHTIAQRILRCCEDEPAADFEPGPHPLGGHSGGGPDL